MAFERHAWSRLNHLQIGRFAEHYVAMEFALYGAEVYTPLVDDRGIDLVIRLNGSFLEVQVKALRWPSSTYIFFRKDVFPLSPTRYAAVVLLEELQEPALYLIPALAWREPHGPFKSRDYVGRASLPEWGLDITKRARPALDAFRFDRQIATLIAAAPEEQPV
ncbi:DUF4365 domain-containing protein [Azospirillum formosense]|uniref:DUF4365 domain-containing protein n=1 Tax=Azospirillum formosense TaxID=861533 RepID=A0ABX2L0Y1_9PROT|nr:DUF4365 domain-containing protein [Azospirillum formosense]MBY3757719.1 DUF4365 domain-containing protein [Azospirillum formosense]NUB21217.1 DUF4365 domain-containing protein [Azospirillum formosense]